MHRAANVYLYEKLIGVLTQNDDGFNFSYLPNYQGIPVSLSLPVGVGDHTSSTLHPFFKSLAPEGWLRKRYSDIQKIDEKDLFGILLNNGNDLIGAITIKGVNHV